VTDRYVDVGEYVRQDSRVVTLVSIDTLRLEFAVPEADVSKVQVDAPVTFKVATYPDRRFGGKVRFVSAAIRPSTRDLVVEAVVDNPDRNLLPGMFADIELSVGTKKLAAVPKEAVFEKDGRSRALFVVDGRLQERILSAMAPVGAFIPAEKGARVGDVVAVGEIKGLANGQRVR
jgi:RND family efflux transporter MFP subunit